MRRSRSLQALSQCRYAFVEFQEERDAEKAYDRTRSLRVDGRDVKVEVRFVRASRSS